MKDLIEIYEAIKSNQAPKMTLGRYAALFEGAPQGIVKLIDSFSTVEEQVKIAHEYYYLMPLSESGVVKYDCYFEFGKRS